VLFQEEKELTDMEVSLHRTRSLLGEKVIRLRHLEQSLQRATVTAENRHEDATLSDISSHSASSGISSTEFATADPNIGKGFIHGEHLQESSEIIQSLENLNSEIREIWDVLRKQHQSGGIATGKRRTPPSRDPQSASDL
jgi:centrosomal protein CEP164